MKSNKHLFRVFLAVLPVLGQTGSFREMFLSAGFTAGLFVASSAFFKISFPLFPKNFFRFAVIIFPATVFQCLYYFFGTPIVWAVSLFLLYDFKELENGGRGNGRIAMRSVFYLVILCAIGLAEQLDAGIFRHPAGALFVLAAVWVLLKGKVPAPKTTGARHE